MLLTYLLNNKEPITVPCGTPIYSSNTQIDGVVRNNTRLVRRLEKTFHY